ncbi:MAG: sigma-E factor negative regulatory protein [Gammaproteobacteria bacterium]|nr:sigma-E factor negative regulatory protein [Gammaproteobacteria bacterium]MBU1441847.1 sigma-E factor negative regulatory protein [Gammaproteobacteria bacterium]MBU2286668.1 sigma-E factor negative regulatory protein [Gammaproteobacteria bacterium]
MNISNSVLEQLSALADGQLRDDELAQMITRVGVDDELRLAWQRYHLIGDVLRAGAHAPCHQSSEFLTRFQSRLESEPVVPVLLPEPSLRLRSLKQEASNEPQFRWKVVAGVASVAAAAAIGWNWMGVGPRSSMGPQIAQQDSSQSLLSVASPMQQSAAPSPMRVIVGSGAPQIMLRDPRLDQLLEAHQQAGGASQMPSGFLRNATFDGPSR